MGTRVLRLTVTPGFGQFYLATGYHEDIVDVVLEAVEGEGIAQSGSGLVVLAPHHHDAPVRFQVEQWAAEPPDDLGRWQDAFAAHLAVGDFGLHYESPGQPSRNLDVPPGGYGVRIAGRGFRHPGAPPSVRPEAEWRVQLWPSPRATAPRRLLRWRP